jgi:hypothetical protein
MSGTGLGMHEMQELTRDLCGLCELCSAMGKAPRHELGDGSGGEGSAGLGAWVLDGVRCLCV